MSRLPKSIIRFSSGARPLELLICGGKEKSDYPWTNRFIGSWPLPTWQRGLVWTIEQKIAFIESVFMGYDLGSVMINELHWPDGQKASTPMSEIIIDGQQRISALVSFVENEFPINGLYWKDLTREEKRTFREREIGVKSVACYDEEKLRIVYNHLNFSGVRHEHSEKA
ncbi:DUF262 domain-containing protein [Vibrio coralliilyticus]|uniref:DUF262 domain-containing protein n=1 Tax=Vibrio coralliilyticus TaxID=190893 RepID=A0AAP7DFT1_9VIBR|nr:DUF262 domain-containing protein [Vibrio coralliilyticus]NOI32021.1 DUF262 domain-containing protein [Vibrio coralliilyticus]NOJ25222.1 DUF262 domain-containing protein [Vibrio coralliilyticus]